MRLAPILIALLIAFAGCAKRSNHSGQILTGKLRPGQRLRKLSLTLRGLTPSEADYRELEIAISSESTSSFFEKKTKEYLVSPQHVGKMIARLDELFRLSASEGLPETRLLKPNEAPINLDGVETWNAMDLLFEQIIQENLSWDNLATAKSYTVTPKPVGFGVSDSAFYNIVSPANPNPGSPVPYRIDFEANDPRIAGAVTTPRFFGRYSTTNLNKNRGRAAAIFRTFLCDDMKAVVTPSAEEEKELIENGFPLPDPNLHSRYSTASMVNAFSDADDKKHGSSPACMNCHYKLDPMGKAFINIGSVLPHTAAWGKLVYKRKDDTFVDYEAKGLGEILRYLTTQPEYTTCQVSHFWRWFVRGDQLPSQERLKELVAEFEKVGRRPNDFIAFLVNQPEFAVDAKTLPTDTTLLQVSPLLTRCNDCHLGSTETKAPSFTQFPIGGDTKNHREWLSLIASKLDLAHNGKDRTMPPPTSVWQPTSDEINLIKQWIGEGAKDDHAESTLSPEEAKELLGGAEVAPPGIRIEFRESYLRYLRTHDLFRLLAQKFPKAKLENVECQKMQGPTRALLGDASPLTGELAFRAPSLAFIRWMGKCLLKSIRLDLTAALEEEKSLVRYLGETANELPPEMVSASKTVLWKTISEPVRQRVLVHLIQYLLGAETTDELTWAKRLDLVLLEVKPEINFFDAMTKTLYLVGSSDEFLTY